MLKDAVLIRYLGQQSYLPVLQAMQQFTANRDAQTLDEIWLMEHPPLYTLGMAGKHEHLLDTGDIPVEKIDRGGQVTYHGPGQLVAYVLLDLRRHGLTVKGLVYALEQAIIDFLSTHDIQGERKMGAPGVYVGKHKIAALGLRIRQGCCYHGLSLNVDMNLAPFDGINPCGYAGLTVTQLRDCGVITSVEDCAQVLTPLLLSALAYPVFYRSYCLPDVLMA